MTVKVDFGRVFDHSRSSKFCYKYLKIQFVRVPQFVEYIITSQRTFNLAWFGKAQTIKPGELYCTGR